MKKTLLFSFLAALALGVGACQKKQTKAERKAEIERQMRQRPPTKRQADDRKKMAQLHAELVARLNALAAAQKHPTATATPQTAESASTPTTNFPPDGEQGSYSTFYSKLGPYGNWMDAGDYGYVFQPRQAAQSRDWRPYTNGHWVYTDAGWTWISDEQFGWATDHYGRWIRLRNVGWVWVPGEHWAPAWVSWRKGSDYVGWAPLPPEAQFDRQIGIRNWADNYYDIGPEQYAFVPASEFGRKVSSREIVPVERNVTIINQTTNVTNITYDNSVIVDRGPSYDDLQSRSHQPIERFRLERSQDFNTDAPVFSRGDIVALPTMDFRPAERAARPNRVVRTITQPVAEHGWTGIRDAPAAQKARAKMQTEATPPANLPPKRFVRPEQKTSIPSRRLPLRVGQAVDPAVSTASAIPVGTPAPLPSNPPQAPPVLPTPAATLRPNSVPAISPRPSGLQSSATPLTATRPTKPSPAGKVFPPKQADQERRDPARVASTPITSDRKSAIEQNRAKRAERRAKRGEGRIEASPEPNHTATPNPQ